MDLRSWLLDWLLLLGLLAASVLVMLTQNRPLSRALQTQAMEMTAEVESSFAWVGRYFRVLEQNEKLRRRNIELSSRVARTRSIRMENQELRKLLGLRDSSASKLVPARIVSKDIFRQENALTINVGQADGVKEGMPVVHQSGIVGRVMFTSTDYSRVMPFLNTDFRVPGTIAPLRTDGIVRWDGERHNRLLLEHVVKTEPVEKGQQVVTSVHSDVFPSGRAIGTIDSVRVRPGRSELLIYLRPTVPLHQINHAFVLLRTPDPEREQLESRSIG